MATFFTSSSAPAVGIDLGTTNSCVAIYLNGRAEVLANDVGERTTPSYVGFTDEEILVGQTAKDQSYRNYKNTIFDVKRLIGKKYNDPKVQEGIKHWPFTVTDRNGNPGFKVKLHQIDVSFCPEEISAIILEKLKEVASQRVEASVTKAVITVPAYFNDSQRQATKDAGKLAGLEVLMLLNEPTAAAITYALDKSSKDCKHTMVFDLGGGTFDVSIVKVENRNVTVKAIHGDSNLGGNDFNLKILKHLEEDIKKRFGYAIQGNNRVIARLLAACEKTKQSLSFINSAEIELDGLIEGKDYYFKLSKAKFEELNKDLFQKTLDIVRSCVKNALLTASDIDNVVLVGGSTKIPRIQYLLQDYFEGKALSKAVNPDEAVAIGACIQAANLNKYDKQVVEDFILKDVVPFSLGIEIAGGIMSTVIKKNTLIPATVKKRYTTSVNDQTHVDIKIFEGEETFTCNNNLLGIFVLQNIPPAPSDVPKIKVSFDIDTNGILNVTAIEKLSNKENKITVVIDKGRLTQAELEKMINKAKKHRPKIEKPIRTKCEANLKLPD